MTSGCKWETDSFLAIAGRGIPVVPRLAHPGKTLEVCAIEP
jgi:hypothetical protein